MENVFYFSEKNVPNPKYVNFENKEELVQLVSLNMLNKLQSMFEWKNLPTTIPQKSLEMSIQRRGYTNIFEWEGNLYQSVGNIGGELNYNYLPRISVISNPYIKNFNSRTFKIYYGKDDVESVGVISNYDGECVVIPNDALFIGVLPLNNLYASQYVENILSKRIVTINSRAMNIFLAGDENAKNDFCTFIKNLIDGKISAVVGKNLMFEPKTLPYAQNNSSKTITELIEDQQYIKASWLNEFGLNANYNMKRESINSNESQLNQDALLPLPDQMLLMRQKACELINEKFGTNWSVDFSSAWKMKRVEIDEAVEAIDENSKVNEENKVQTSEQEKVEEVNNEEE